MVRRAACGQRGKEGGASKLLLYVVLKVTCACACAATPQLT